MATTVQNCKLLCSYHGQWVDVILCGENVLLRYPFTTSHVVVNKYDVENMFLRLKCSLDECPGQLLRFYDDYVLKNRFYMRLGALSNMSFTYSVGKIHGHWAPIMTEGSSFALDLMWKRGHQ